ncbi:MAG: hypothetical protein A2Y62_02685 [Candidatus Fischerbacteria bacterium RBG_13_37_8]|uniref:Uncharacterized protein n=1 Tax=Candidatus Fischerbacteria bacterium RBG_13_37_8 TaxID=1817863 RepID=A0A1F5VS99_9BACT|nr:MAG: hypothetical protein A2Y62_02685 [Candidatus Fischerbacteria bacterium RBG_13_37_8]
MLASIIGLGLLASGIINLSFSFNERVMNFSTIIIELSNSNSKDILLLLFVSSIGITLGFSERLFFSFTSTIAEQLSSKKNKGSNESETDEKPDHIQSKSSDNPMHPEQKKGK